MDFIAFSRGQAYRFSAEVDLLRISRRFHGVQLRLKRTRREFLRNRFDVTAAGNFDEAAEDYLSLLLGQKCVSALISKFGGDMAELLRVTEGFIQNELLPLAIQFGRDL